MKHTIFTALNLPNGTASEALLRALAFGAYALLFLLFAWLPSVVMPELMHPTQTGKSFVFGMFILGLVLLSAFRLIFTYHLKVRVTIVDAGLGLLLIYIVLNRYLLQDIHGFSMKYCELVGLVVLYIILRNTSPRYYLWFLLAVIYSGLIQAVYGSPQLWSYYPSHHSGFSMTGSFFNPGPYAGFLAGVFPVALGLYLFRKKIQPVDLLRKDVQVPFTRTKISFVDINPWITQLTYEYLPLAGVFAILMAIPASQSRASWLAIISSSLLLVFIRYNIWSLFIQQLKSWIRGIYHKVSDEYLQGYLDEFCFRINRHLHKETNCNTLLNRMMAHQPIPRHKLVLQ